MNRTINAKLEAIRQELSEVSKKTIAGWHADAATKAAGSGNTRARAALNAAEKAVKEAINLLREAARHEPRLAETMKQQVIPHYQSLMNDRWGGSFVDLHKELATFDADDARDAEDNEE